MGLLFSAHPCGIPLEDPSACPLCTPVSAANNGTGGAGWISPVVRDVLLVQQSIRGTRALTDEAQLVATDVIEIPIRSYPPAQVLPRSGHGLHTPHGMICRFSREDAVWTQIKQGHNNRWNR